jgi:hypothetical protein
MERRFSKTGSSREKIPQPLTRRKKYCRTMTSKTAAIKFQQEFNELRAGLWFQPELLQE